VIWLAVKLRLLQKIYLGVRRRRRSFPLAWVRHHQCKPTSTSRRNLRHRAPRRGKNIRRNWRRGPRAKKVTSLWGIRFVLFPPSRWRAICITKFLSSAAADRISCFSLSFQAIADVAEAIVGAAYISGGRECALRALKTMTIPLPGINTWSDFGARVVIPYPSTVATLPPESIQAVERIIGHQFRLPHLLAQAMVRKTLHFWKATEFHIGRPTLLSVRVE